MKYYFSSATGKHLQCLLEQRVTRLLFSYVANPEYIDKIKVLHDTKNGELDMLIDSGAFTVWNKARKEGGEGKIDVEAYKDFCLQLPQEWTFINVDVIPQTGSTKKEVQKCIDESFENFLYLNDHLPSVMPVYHYGEDKKWLRTYEEITDFIGVSPANDTHESVKRRFLAYCYKDWDKKKMYHALGYSSFIGLRHLPLYSVDSITYKRVPVFTGHRRQKYYSHGKLFGLLEKEVRHYLKMEKYFTALWEARGIKYPDHTQRLRDKLNHTS